MYKNNKIWPVGVDIWQECVYTTKGIPEKIDKISDQQDMTLW